MTHNSDCVVRDREALNRIADCYGRAENIAKSSEYSDLLLECRGTARENGLEFIGSGVGRDVFRVTTDETGPDTDCVVKVGRSTGGKITNKTEVEIWEKADEQFREALVPIKDHSGIERISDISRGVKWLSMPFYEPITDNKEIPPAVREISKKIRNAGWKCTDVRNPDNIGKQHGEVRVFDYGEGCSQR